MKKQLRIAFYQPDIPQNLGAMMRLAVCLDVGIDVIMPCGFPWDDKKIRRAGMDYIDHCQLQKHDNWENFKSHYADRRIVLMTTKAEGSFYDFAFEDGDILLAGSESSGVPEYVHNDCTERLTIKMAHNQRSLNVVNATSMIIGEAIRQTK
tara:strand:- start:283 stop:735 length:453 start_codon:yes stop_codon:yes gene_type:complete